MLAQVRCCNRDGSQMGRSRKGHNKANLITAANGGAAEEEAILLEAGLAGPKANVSIFQRVCLRKIFLKP